MSHGISNLVKQLSPREQFKVAFLEKCAEQGLTADEMLEKVKKAQDIVKQGSLGQILASAGKGVGLGALSAATGLTQALGNYAIPLALAAPVAAGGLAGHQLATAQEPTDEDVKDVQHAELVDMYRKQTERLRREQASREYRAKDSGRGGRPML